MTLTAKIAAFKKEVGDRALSVEQRKIFAAFTKEKGSKIYFQVKDCEGVALRIQLVSSATNKIMQKHYKTTNGTVTANDILNMFDVVRSGDKYFSNENYVYAKTRRKNGVTYKTVIKIFSNGKDASMLSFHSTIGYEKEKKAANLLVSRSKETLGAKSGSRRQR